MAYASRIANELLVTPFDNQSVVSAEVTEKLTEEEFCKHCYSHPKFERKSREYMQESEAETDNDSPTSKEELEEQLYKQKTAYENFKLWLHNFGISKVYTINGNAGTGKTTFINYERYHDKEIKWIILDIHGASSYVEWITDIRTNVAEFDKAQSKVYGCIMGKIWELVFQGLDENGEFSLVEVYKNLTRLVKNYNEYFAASCPSGRKLLDAVSKALETKGSMLSKVEACAEEFKNHINGKTGPSGDGTNGILNILLLVIRCMAENIDEKYIIVFDNFERFIGKNELYNRDVDKVRLQLNSYISTINKKGNCHRNHFKFAMAVRDSTARMCSVRLQAADTEPSNLDLSNWYDTENIISLKRKWYREHEIHIANSELVQQITGDIRTCKDSTITGLQLMLNPLFNDNKRLLIDFIGRIVELPGNDKIIKKYLEMWEEDTGHSRFAARSIMRGLVLHSLESEKDKLFEHLQTYSSRHDRNGMGDARLILTILYNKARNGEEEEVPVTTLLAELFSTKDPEGRWNSEEYSGKRETISEILFYMNSYNRRENDWIQFIDIQFKNSEENVIVNESSDLERLLCTNMKNCTVHLMPGGKVYLERIVASFEFFSLRYCKHYAPLFALIPQPGEVEKCRSVIELPCYQTVTCVVKYALTCIEILIDREDTIRLKIGNASNGIYHSTRIINHHKSYIESFSTYIYKKYCDSENLSYGIREKYRKLCRLLLDQSGLYNQYENRGNRAIRR